jgi:sugar phosphate isomerase/epimerase
MSKKTLFYNLKYCAKGSREIGDNFVKETNELAKIVDCIEIDFNWPHNQDFEKEIEFLIRLEKEKGIQYVAHAPYFDGGLNAFNEKIRSTALEEIFYSINMACKLKSKVVVLHPAIEPYGLKISKREKLEIDSYKKIARYAKSKNVLVGLENEAQTNFWFPDRACKFQPIEKIIQKVNQKNFGLTLDIGHANIAGEDFIGAISKFKDKIFHIHAHDNFGKRAINGRLDPHLPPGDGGIDWRNVIKALEKINYQGYFEIECNLEGIKKGINFLEKEKSRALGAPNMKNLD